MPRAIWSLFLPGESSGILRNLTEFETVISHIVTKDVDTRVHPYTCNHPYRSTHTCTKSHREIARTAAYNWPHTSTPPHTRTHPHTQRLQGQVTEVHTIVTEVVHTQSLTHAHTATSRSWSYIRLSLKSSTRMISLIRCSGLLFNTLQNKCQHLLSTTNMCEPVHLDGNVQK